MYVGKSFAVPDGAFVSLGALPLYVDLLFMDWKVPAGMPGMK